MDLVRRQGAIVLDTESCVRRVDLVTHRADWRRADRIMVDICKGDCSVPLFLKVTLKQMMRMEELH